MQEAEVRAVYPKAHRYALSLTGNADDAGDLVQSAFLKCLQAEHKQPIRDLGAYLRTTMLHTWISQKRRGAVVSFLSIELVQNGRDPAFAAMGRRCAEIERFAYWDALLAQIRGLPPPLAEAMWQVCIADRSMEEAAATLGVSVMTVKARLHRARQRLQERWEGA